MVPMIWSIVYRVPISFYRSRMEIHTGSTEMIIALQLAFDLWILFVVSSTVAEALHFETWKGPPH